MQWHRDHQRSAGSTANSVDVGHCPRQPPARRGVPVQLEAPHQPSRRASEPVGRQQLGQMSEMAMSGRAPAGRSLGSPTPRTPIGAPCYELAPAWIAQHRCRRRTRTARRGQNKVQQRTGQLPPNAANGDQAIVHTCGGTRWRTSDQKCRALPALPALPAATKDDGVAVRRCPGCQAQSRPLVDGDQVPLSKSRSTKP